MPLATRSTVLGRAPRRRTEPGSINATNAPLGIKIREALGFTSIKKPSRSCRKLVF